MKFSRSKTMATAVSLFLLFAMVVSLVALPTANAQTTKKTYAYIGAVPNPVGVDQETLLHLGITDAHIMGVGYGWEDLTVTVTRPDGVVDTLGPFKTDPTGGTGTVYVPAAAGTYYLQTNFPAQWYNYTTRDFFGNLITSSTWLKASTSEKLALNVTDEPLEYYPATPLPTEYWTRPIDTQLREWSTIAGSWLQTPYNLFAVGNEEAPDTAHILWTKPFTQGGLVGETSGQDLDQHSFEIGDAYEGKWSNRFILAGKLYYDKYSSSDRYHEIVCVDLHTGEELWSKVFPGNATISFCQLMYWDTYDYHGVFDYLWISIGGGFDWATFTWLPGELHAFDPITGDWVYAMYGLPSGTRVTGPKGEILYYNINTRNGWMTLWNSSNVPELYGDREYNSMSWGSWRPQGKTVNVTGPAGVTLQRQPYVAPTTPLGLAGYQLNVTIPKGLPGSVTAIFYGDRVVGGSISLTEVRLWGFNLNASKGTLGQLLFNNTWNAPSEWAEGNVTVSGFGGGWMAWSQEDKVGVLWVKETREHYGFSLETGKNIWGPTEPQYYLDSIDDSSADVRNIAYGKLYSASVGGIVYCYDVQTGERLWTYEATDPYSEILWANNWWLKPVFICDGKIYVGHCEHSPIDPRPRGAPFICLNATTGEEIWRINGAFRQTRWGGRAIIGDSIIATQDTYDQRVYAIGKGPSATTVTAAPKVSVHSSSVLVEGMVIDVSPGTQEYSKTARFPNGVPAVSDENMSDWMLYVYKQFAKPADAVGVEVVVEVLDPNNNFYEVGRTTSDASGYFGCAFTPEVPGLYKIIASFEGSGAYYGSSAETFINVEDAPQATPPPTPTPASVADMYFLPVSTTIIVAIVVIGLILILMLRKR